jgi:hypothetical protein
LRKGCRDGFNGGAVEGAFEGKLNGLEDALLEEIDYGCSRGCDEGSEEGREEGCRLVLHLEWWRAVRTGLLKEYYRCSMKGLLVALPRESKTVHM